MNLKPGVPGRVLLYIAAVVWTLAAVMLFWRGYALIHASGFPVSWAVWISLPLGLFFYLLLFLGISVKNAGRILRMTVDRPCAFSFFSIKGYLMMIIMIGAGIFLRKTGSVDSAVIGVFYWIMGLPLLLSSFRYWYFSARYMTFRQQFGAEGENLRPHHPVWKKRFTNFLSLSIVLLVLLIAFSNYRITHTARPFLYSNAEEIPVNKVAVVPGTSSKVASGHENLFFKYRIQAVADLYFKGKINAIIVSGDNGTIYYNEPVEMKKALVNLNIPDSVIYLDYAGFRTFDSVIRAWKIFGQKKFTFVSQPFQNERAVFIGRRYGIEIIAYNARDVNTYSSFKTMVRELFARVKVMLDLYLLNQQPRFLGDPVIIR